jgi:putative aldouronate transport system substrate-binding protein
MKNAWKFIIALALCCVFVLPSVFAGGRRDNGQSGGPVDMSRELRIVGYLLGEENVGFQNVMKKINEKLKKDVNATMDIRFIGWGDLSSKYPLILASGDLDWIYTAPWCYYGQEAQKGAFMPLTEEMIRQNMPLHYAALDKAAYRQATLTVNGKKNFYMIPTSTPDKKSSAIAVRKDLREKYGIPPIKKISDIEPYLAAVKRNEPGMTPMLLDNTYDIKRMFSDQMTERGTIGEDTYFATGGGLNIMYDWQNTSGRIFTFFEEPYRSNAIEVCKIVKRWFDLGYVNSDVFGNKVRSKESYAQGKSAVAFGNSGDLVAPMIAARENGWESEEIAILLPSGKRQRDAYTNNGVALAATCRNPERVLMALDKIFDDPEYCMLERVGIEGENYIINSEGKIALPPGVSAESNTYPDTFFWFASQATIPPRADWPETYIAHYRELDNILVNNPMTGFELNKANVRTEEANCSSVFAQYGTPLFVGAVNNVETAFAELEQKARAAGYDRLVDEAKKQIAEFVALLNN